MNRLDILKRFALVVLLATAGCAAEEASSEDEVMLENERASRTGGTGTDSSLGSNSPTLGAPISADLHLNDLQENQGPHPDPWRANQGPHPDPWSITPASNTTPGSTSGNSNTKP